MDVVEASAIRAAQHGANVPGAADVIQYRVDLRTVGGVEIHLHSGTVPGNLNYPGWRSAMGAWKWLGEIIGGGKSQANSTSPLG